jgi:phosphoribosyl 1,2-cyclic phosphate phosphodiesterase
MKVRRRFTILGCGSSPGVPRVDGEWGACDPENPKNRRTRAAFLIEQIGPDGTTTVAVDTGPDFRQQMIAAGVIDLDAVVYTHPHADHIHGIDDVRIFALKRRRQIPIHADAFTMERIREGFSYCIETPPGSDYPPIVRPEIIAETGEPFVIGGLGGPIPFQPLKQIHGSITSLGFRIGDVAYCCDISGFPDETVPKLQDLDVLIVDALQYKTHPSHFSLGEALEWIEQLKPRQTYLTHMHVPLDYDTVARETPNHVTPAHDMLAFEFEIALAEEHA